ncbi:MAG: GDYXXLXY domain-containing protein [Castellaniella sp.]|uniref:GDYXXLXY domain-containing protein n=3 Tax=Castellaniella sp. TaxID=1955812 RepID=UPI003C73C875
MQVTEAGPPAEHAVRWRQGLAHGAGLLAAALAGAALVFWVAANWPQMTQDARLTGVQGVLALLVVLAVGLAWRGHRGAEPAAGLAALATGALLALVGQIYQTGADAWQLFLTWAVLILPWLVVLRSVFLVLLWGALLNLALWLFLDGSTAAAWWRWGESWSTGIWLLGLNALLLIGAECLRPVLRDPWRLIRRTAAAATLAWAVAVAAQGAVMGFAGMWAQSLLPALAFSLVPILAIYAAYTRWRRDPAVATLALLAGIGVVGFLLVVHVESAEGVLGLALLILALGLGAARHALQLWAQAVKADGAGASPAASAASDRAPVLDPAGASPAGRLEAPAGARDEDHAPWYVTALRMGILAPVVLLLGVWVAISFDLDSAADALSAGVLLMLGGLALGRMASRASWQETGGVLAILGLLLCAAGVWMLADEGGPWGALPILLAAGAAAYAGTRQFAVRLAAAGLTLGLGCWLTMPRGFLYGWGDGSASDWATGLAWRLTILLVLGAIVWIVSQDAARRARWRPLAWAALTTAAGLALQIDVLEPVPFRSLPWTGQGGLLIAALLPGAVLGAWMALSRPRAPANLCLGVSAAYGVAGLGWLGAPACAVALVGLVLGRWSGNRPAQALSVLLGLVGLAVYYFDPSVTLVAKAARLGLAAVWLAALALWLRAPWRRADGTARSPAARRAWGLPVGLLAGGVLVLGVVQARVHHYEAILDRGRPVILALAPVDPRSLMQGDYMDLDYAVRRLVEQWLIGQPDARDALQANGRGWLLLRPDAQGVWQFEGLVAGPAPTLEASELAIKFRWRNGEMDWGARHWFFPEGQGERYARARYGELRVAEDGTALLARLLDETRAPL